MIKTDYDLLIQQAEALTKDCPHLIANLANISALLFTTLDDINWAGFYFVEHTIFELSHIHETPVRKDIMSTKSSEPMDGGDVPTEPADPEMARLILGPFQGNPACIEIPLGKGVCGTAALEDRTQLVPDVHQFPGHIACDIASRSEIVVPIHKKRTNVRTTCSSGSNNGTKENGPESAGTVIAVLDIDSPSLARFTEEDQLGLEKLVSVLERTVFA